MPRSLVTGRAPVRGARHAPVTTEGSWLLSTRVQYDPSSGGAHALLHVHGAQIAGGGGDQPAPLPVRLFP